MNFLFVHQNFPGQYYPLIKCLLTENKSLDKPHLIVFLTEEHFRSIYGVTKVVRKAPVAIHPNSLPKIHRDCFEFDRAMHRSELTYRAAIQLKEIGFRPDIIIGHHGWGELLGIRDVFPHVPLLGYFEFFYHSDKNDAIFDPEFPIPHDRLAGVRAKNAVNLIALSLGQHGQTPTNWQKSTYPIWSQSSIRIIREGVPLDICFPAPEIKSRRFELKSLIVEANQKLLTYVARNLEPYRGFHTFMRALPGILRNAPEIVVAITGGDDVSYGAAHRDGSWKNVLLQEMSGKIDLTRIHFLGTIPYEDHLRILKRSDVHVYISYPFVASWSLREALACGCAVIGFNNIMTREFITHGKNGILIDSLNTSALEEAVCSVLATPVVAAELGRAARNQAVVSLDQDHSNTMYRKYIDSLVYADLPETSIPMDDRHLDIDRQVFCKPFANWHD